MVLQVCEAVGTAEYKAVLLTLSNKGWHWLPSKVILEFGYLWENSYLSHR